MMQSCGGALTVCEMSVTSVAIPFSPLVATEATSLATLDAPHCPWSRFSLVDRRIVDFYSGSVAEGFQHLVAPGDNLVALVQSAFYLDVAGPGESRFHGAEFGLVVFPDHENSLQFLRLFFRRRRRNRLRLAVLLRVLRFQSLLVAHGECLD